ncbi:MAG: ATP-binding protein [Fimbriimonadales bacterium]|nr:ATP-binding protein [Fimbriimonadales bacterium]
MGRDDTIERRRRALVASPLFNLTFMPSLLLLPDSLRIYRATDAATRILGYSHEELAQRTLYDLLVESKEQVDAILARARAHPPFVLNIRRPTREERIIEGIVHELPAHQLLHFSFADLTDLHLPRRILLELARIPPQHTGIAFLSELVRALSAALGGAYVYVGRVVEVDRVEGVAYAVGGELLTPVEYSLQHTPCENVVMRGVCVYPRSVQKLFPKDADLAQLGAEGYIGAPLRDAYGRPIGTLWAITNNPLPGVPALYTLWQILATRAAHELLRARAEAEAEQLRAQLLRAQKMESIGRMAGGLAHDFNNLLTAVLGHIELAQSALPADSAAHGFLNNALLAVEKAAGITRQLMTLVRQQPIQRQRLNLNTVVRETLQLAQTWLPSYIQVQTYLTEPLWQVEADPAHLNQVLQNLLLNARDAIPDTGGVITIETKNVELDAEYARMHHEVVPGEYVMLMVSDTGIGMRPEVRERIFEPFFTTKPRDQGTGLGLSIAYSIIHQLGGHIWVYSEEGRGTTFKIYLPRAYELLPRLMQTAIPPTELPRGQETIMVVEDEPGVLEVVTEILQQQGYTALAARSPVEALQIAQSYDKPIHLLITDVVMPVMSGRELADYLVRLYPRLRVLYVSGYTGNTIVHHGVLEAGIHFLPKPYTPSQLIQRVREVLDSE